MIDLPPVPMWAVILVVALLVFSGMGIGLFAFTVVLAHFDSRRTDPPEPISVAVVPEPEPASMLAIEAAPVVAEEVPAPVVIEVLERAVPDLLPPPPPRRDEVPVFAQVPVRLPQYDSIDWKFFWNKPTDPNGTGTYPLVLRDDVDDLYEVSEVPAKSLPGFEVDPSARSRFKRSDKELRAQADALGFPTAEPVEVSA